MSLFALVIVELADDNAGARRLADRQMRKLGLAPVIGGQKGVVRLPERCYGGQFPGAGRDAVAALQERLIDDCHDHLMLMKLEGNAFVLTSETWSWHFRPFPRRRPSKRSATADATQSDSSSEQATLC